MEVDNPKESEKEKDNNATAEPNLVVDIDLEPQETENNEQKEDILRMEADEYDEFAGETVKDESNLDLLDKEEPVVTKEYKEIQSSFEYPMSEETSGGHKNRKDPERGKGNRETKSKLLEISAVKKPNVQQRNT